MEKSQESSFLRQKWLNFWILGVGYAIFYYGRYNLSTAHAEIAKYLKWEYTNYGKIMFVALLVYGLNVLFAGPTSDRIGGKASMLIGVIGSMISNTLFGLTYYLVKDGYTNPTVYWGFSLSHLFILMTFIWTTNYFFQSFGALSIVKINSAWNKKEERGSYAGKFGVLLQIGRALVLITCPWILSSLKWPFVFFIPATLQLVMSFLIWRLVKNSPEEMGIDFNNKSIEHKSMIETFREVFSIKNIMLVCSIAFVAGMIRGGIEHYVSRFFIEQFHVDRTKLGNFPPYILFSIMMPAMMMIASFGAGVSSDKYLKSRRFPIILIGFLLAAVFLFCLTLDMKNAYFSSVFLVFVMFSLQIVNNILMGVVTIDLGESKLSGSIAGLFDGTQYFGGSFSSLLIGFALTNTHTWKAWPIVLIPAGIAGIILSTIMTERENGNINNKLV